jgi:hypothetical protein
VSLAATRELAARLGVEPLTLLQANRDRPWKYEQGSLAFASLMEGDVVRAPDGRELVIERMGFLGASFSDFATTGSKFSGAWDDIASQLGAENATSDDVNAAKQAFTDQYASLISSQFGIDSGQAIEYAQKYTIAARTVVGAVENVAGLVAAAQNASTPAEVQSVFQTVMGTLVGAAVAAGAVSAGVGALIVAAVGAALTLFESAGMFGSTPSGTEICPGFYVSGAHGGPAAWAVGCAAVGIATRATPGSVQWRRFPEPTTDPGWYAQGPGNTVLWHGDVWAWPAQGAAGSLLVPGSGANAAPILPGIGYALPDFFDLTLGTGIFLVMHPEWQWFHDFHLAFLSAWKANKEFAFNGLKVQPDWQVLLHVANLWNRAHDGTTFVDLGPPTPGSGIQEQTILQEAFYTKGADDPASYLFAGKLRIHTGAKKTPRKILAFHLGGKTTTPAAAAPGLSTGEKVGIGVGGATVAAGGLWLALGKPLAWEAAKAAFSHWLDRL